jgi:hypothetical protein
MRSNNIKNLSEIIGVAHIWITQKSQK